jgi:hypothetical protein
MAPIVAVLWFRWLAAGFPLRRPGSGHVEFVVHKMALGHVFSEYFGFPCQFAFHRLIHNHHHHRSSGADIIGQTVDAIPSAFSHTPWRINGPNCGVRAKLHLMQKLRLHIRSRDSAVGIATGYGVDDRGIGVRSPVGSRIFSSPRRSDRLLGTPNLLCNVYRWLFPRGKTAAAWNWRFTSN